jgi:hypothetical protein
MCREGELMAVREVEMGKRCDRPVWGGTKSVVHRVTREQAYRKRPRPECSRSQCGRLHKDGGAVSAEQRL